MIAHTEYTQHLSVAQDYFLMLTSIRAGDLAAADKYWTAEKVKTPSVRTALRKDLIATCRAAPEYIDGPTKEFTDLQGLTWLYVLRLQDVQAGGACYLLACGTPLNAKFREVSYDTRHLPQPLVPGISQDWDRWTEVPR